MDKYRFIHFILAVMLISNCNNAEYNGASDNLQDEYKNSTLQPVLFNEVQVEDNFWSPKIEQIQKITIPLLLDIAEKQGKIDNFRIVAGQKEGKISLYNAPDSDVYKLLEAASYTLAWQKDKKLEKRVDEIIGLIADAQDENGYLHTQYMLPFSDPASPDTSNPKVKTFGYGPDDRWNSRVDNWPYAYSQLYCAGHLMEAAIAHYRATGKHSFLDVAIKMGDHIVDVFDKEKIQTYADHPEVEIGLMKLYEVTRNEAYRNHADLFSRYVKFTRPVDVNQQENSKPLADQRDAFGHAVRTSYIYAGATDVVRSTGASDLRTAIDSLWKSITGRKMYIHGGVGNGTKAEQYGYDYDLPIRKTYSESCASVAQGQWNRRLNLLTGDARYADVMELEAYNSALAAISLNGEKFFYANKLNMNTENRKGRHSGVRETYLFCCPSKVPGFVSGISRWIYAKDENGIYVNLFIGSKVQIDIGGREFVLNQQSRLPWNGAITLTAESDTDREMALRIRIPSWVRSEQPIPGGLYYYGKGKNPSYEIKINGELKDVKTNSQGYAVLTRQWEKGDDIDIQFDMPVRRIYTSDKVKANRGRVALMRGPLLYGLEGIDNDFDVLEMQLRESGSLETVFKPHMLGGIMTINGQGNVNGKAVNFTAIPYYAWENRGIYQMATLLIEDPAKVRKEAAEPETEFNTDG